MFYKNTIEKIELKIFSLKSKCNVLGSLIDELENKTKELENQNKALMQSNEEYHKTFEQISEDMQKLDQMDKGLLECVKNDRKDLTALINIVKTIKTTTKKGKK